MDSKATIRKALVRSLVIHNWSEPAAQDFVALFEQLLSVQSAQETVPAPEASLVKTLERSPRRIGTGHGDNCPCWDCTRDQFGI